MSTEAIDKIPKHLRTRSEYIVERRPSKSMATSGLLSTIISKPIILRCKMSVSANHQCQTTYETQSFHHSPYFLAVPANPSHTGFSGESKKISLARYPLGPGGYGGRLEDHFFFTIARIIAVVTTAIAIPAYLSEMDKDKDMVERREQGRLLEIPTRVVQTLRAVVAGSNGLAQPTN